MGVIPAEMIVPVPHTGHKLCGVRVSWLTHRVLAGVEPGHYDSGVGLRQAFPIRDTVPP